MAGRANRCITSGCALASLFPHKISKRRFTGHIGGPDGCEGRGADGRPAAISNGLHIFLAIYGALYLVFVIVGFIPASEGSPVAASVPYHPFGLEGSLVKVLFALFLVGVLTAWRNQLAAGVLFLFWWAGMWGMETLMVSRGLDGGAIVMGFPMFVLGVLFVINGLRSSRVGAARLEP
jgi:hypothetical protein